MSGPLLQKIFSVTELRTSGRDQQGQLIFTDTPVRFEWTAGRQSSPRPSWKFGVHLRSVREDYPGANEPVEQILGSNFTPFTISGVWDDRYNAADFAKNSWKSFENMVRRGNYVRIQFETIDVTGIITDALFDYRRETYIGYDFTISPHFRKQGEGRETIKPPAITDPAFVAKDVRTIVDEANRLNKEDCPALRTVGTLSSDLSDIVSTWAKQADAIDDVVENRILGSFDQAVDGFSRLAQGMSSVRGTAQTILNRVESLDSTSNLAYETAIDTLDFEVWTRGLAYQARLMTTKSFDAQQNLNLRVTPAPKAIYRPHAGESLYGISQRFYGTPHHWREIQQANGLHLLTLTGSELLLIPEAT